MTELFDQEEVLKRAGVTDLVKSSGVELTKAQGVLSCFSNLFDEAAEWERKVSGLVITDISQTAEMQTARQARLALKDVRVKAEKVKKNLKEGILIEGRLIDGIYNAIVAVTKPLEDDLLEKEKFVERIEEAKRLAIKKDREDRLSPYCDDVGLYKLEEMTAAGFEQLLSASKVAKEARLEAERKAGAERIERERAALAEIEKQRLENIQLKEEAEKRKREIEKEREKLLAREAEERQKREQAEQEARSLRDAEEKRRQEEARKQKEIEALAAAEKRRIEKEKREKESAPDKDKIKDFIDLLNELCYPVVSTEEAKSIINGARQKIGSASAALSEWVHGGK
jgi:DNA repair exonuclease SbcCD ATPase subunit